jgi:endo-1,4-beta-xylanase
MNHFKGKLSSWNVVNEAISDKRGEYLRDTAALRAIGEDYVQKAFEFAQAADPNVPLYYNDYNVENPVKLRLDVDILPRNGRNPYIAGVPDKVLEDEARRYAELFAIFQRHRDLIPGVTFWGVEDGQSWLNDTPWKRRTNYPLLFDRKLRAKPAFDAVIKVLSKE